MSVSSNRANLPALALVLGLLAGCNGATKAPEVSLQGVDTFDAGDALLPSLGDPDAASLRVTAKILSVDGDTARLDRGARHGVRVRTVFEIYRKGEVVNLPFSDEVIYEPQKAVALAVVRFVDSDSCEATLVGDDDLAATAGLIAVTARFSRPPSLPPALRAAPDAVESSYGSRTPIAFEVEGETREWASFTWEASAGHLASRITPGATNFFYPPQGGDATITIVARSRDGETSSTLQVKGAGALQTAALRPLQTLTPFGGVTHLVDVSFAADGSSCTLEADESGSRLVFREADGAELGRATSETRFVNVIATGTGVTLLSAQGVLSRYVRPAAGALSTLFEGRPRVFAKPGRGNARLMRPVDMTVGPAGFVYVLDAGQASVQLFEPSGRFLVSFGQPGDRAGGMLEPVALAAFEDQVLVLDDGRKTLLRFRRGRLVQELPVGGPGDTLTGVAVDPQEPIAYVVESSKGIVKRLSLTDGSMLDPISPAPGFEALDGASRLRIDPLRRLNVIDRGGRSIARFSAEGAFAGRAPVRALAQDVSFAAGPGGEMAVVDRDRQVVYCVRSDGWVRWRKVAGEADAPLAPKVVQFDDTGRILVLDDATGKVFVFAPDGKREAMRGADAIETGARREGFERVVDSARSSAGYSVVSSQDGGVVAAEDDTSVELVPWTADAVACDGRGQALLLRVLDHASTVTVVGVPGE